jgi:hypothetical protein
MPANYVLLEKITVGAAGAASVTFSGIPQTGYTDLVVKASMRSDVSGVSSYARMTFNGVTTNVSSKVLYGISSTAGSFNAPSYTFNYVSANGYTANTFGNAEFYIPNYASSTVNKSISIDSAAENNATEGPLSLTAGLWSNTAPITSITLASYNNSTDAAANFVQGSTFYLYGVAKLGTTPAIVPYATGGDTIMTDGTYWYHTFISSGTFTPAKPITCDYLVVAGGGGGGGDIGGAGGAGGLRSTVTATGGGGSLETALSLVTSAYTVTIGAGGSPSTNGSNSVFSTITSTGGGAGGALQSNGGNGGSGGGGGGAFSGTGGANGTGTANQGFNGGTSAFSPGRGGAGGGGAGAVGSNGIAGNYPGGAGGAGVAVSITGSSVTYAGGGGGGGTSGGTGGAGGGGNGGAASIGANGTANTGGGAGGGGNGGRAGGTGGSGIVIVRYAV